jgi:predicted transcriptional regulator
MLKNLSTQALDHFAHSRVTQEEKIKIVELAEMADTKPAMIVRKAIQAYLYNYYGQKKEARE